MTLESSGEEIRLVPPFPMLMFLLLAVLLGSLIGSAVVYAISIAMGVDLIDLLASVDQNSPPESRNFIRLANLITHLMTFSVPVIALAYAFFRDRWAEFLRLSRYPAPLSIGLGILFIMAAFPLAQTTYWFNQQLPMPEWARQLENNAAGMLEGLLVMERPGELYFNLLVVAVIPALGEELLFRGGIQQNLQAWTGRPHLAVWLTAVAFSAIHLQFEGFIPRLILGAALGYLFLWTRNLWIPIIAHFAFNGAQVVARYKPGEDTQVLNMDEVQDPQWVAFAVGLLVFFGAGFYLRKINLDAENTVLEKTDHPTWKD